jgi:hypothetical protein
VLVAFLDELVRSGDEGEAVEMIELIEWMNPIEERRKEGEGRTGERKDQLRIWIWLESPGLSEGNEGRNGVKSKRRE